MSIELVPSPYSQAACCHAAPGTTYDQSASAGTHIVGADSCKPFGFHLHICRIGLGDSPVERSAPKTATPHSAVMQHRALTESGPDPVVHSCPAAAVRCEAENDKEAATDHRRRLLPCNVCALC